MSNNVTTRSRVAFAAIDKYEDINILQPTEKLNKAENMMEWGTRNAYPDYLLSLYDNVPTLRSIVNGNVDFVGGDDVHLNIATAYGPDKMNRRGDTIREQVKDIARDFEIYGGFALQIIRNAIGEVAEVYYVDMRFLRTNKEADVFYYCEKWNKGGQKKDVIIYPAYMPGLKWETLSDEERRRHASSILFMKNTHTQVYPAPLYAAAVKDCEIEKNITDFHLNSIANGFAPSVIVNFNNGQPSEEIAEEIENDYNEKFSGSANGGRAMLCWNKSKDNATTFEYPKVDDFGDRYQALAVASRQHIFTAFRANPNLFGIPTEGNGFTNEQYEESFNLYNRTHVLPVQQIISEAYEHIFGQPDAIEITPFSLGDNDTAGTLASQLGVGGAQAMMAVLESATLTIEQKRGTIQVLFGLDEESACKILGIPYIPVNEE